MKNNRNIGSFYEEVACNYLLDHGYEIIERNFRCRIGEIDIIARDKSCLCFIEVKYRADKSSGMPYEAVNLKKQKTIFNVASVYLKKNQLSFFNPYRFDVVSILNNEITLYKNAFGSI